MADCFVKVIIPSADVVPEAAGSGSWLPIGSAPTDGKPFYSLSITCNVGGGKPWRTGVALQILTRDERGYFSSWFYKHVIASSMRGHFWAPLDALPIADYWREREAERIRDGGEPYDLPEPFGTGERMDATPAPLDTTPPQHELSNSPQGA